MQAEYRVVGSSSAAHGLDDVAEAEGASMIVVGSSPRGARRRISPGSTGERLLHGAICPVAVAPRGHARAPDGRAGAADRRRLRRQPGGARGAAAWRPSWPRRPSATLTLYTVVAPRAEVVAPVIGRDAEISFLKSVREGARAALDEALASLPEGVSATAELLEGDVDRRARLARRA